MFKGLPSRNSLHKHSLLVIYTHIWQATLTQKRAPFTAEHESTLSLRWLSLTCESTLTCIYLMTRRQKLLDTAGSALIYTHKVITQKAGTSQNALLASIKICRSHDWHALWGQIALSRCSARRIKNKNSERSTFSTLSTTEKRASSAIFSLTFPSIWCAVVSFAFD